MQNELYGSFFKNAPFPCAILRVMRDANRKPFECRFIDMNATFEKWTGVSATEFLGKSAISYISGLIGNESGCLEWADKVAFQMNDTVTEYCEITTEHQYRGSAYALKEGAFCLVLYDITREEPESETGKNRFETILESVPAIIYSIAGKPGAYRYTYVSQNIRNLFGYEPNDFINDEAFHRDHMHPDDRRPFFEKTSKEPERGFFDLGEYRFRDRNGRYHWIYDKQSIISGENGKKEIVGTWWDITERKFADEQLREAKMAIIEKEQRYHSLFNQFHDAVFILDLHGRISESNYRAEEMLGYTKDELKGLPLSVISGEPGQSADTLQEVLDFV